jgi:membrane protease YdiL (CAAX protease family)
MKYLIGLIRPIIYGVALQISLYLGVFIGVVIGFWYRNMLTLSNIIILFDHGTLMFIAYINIKFQLIGSSIVSIIWILVLSYLFFKFNRKFTFPYIGRSPYPILVRVLVGFIIAIASIGVSLFVVVTLSNIPHYVEVSKEVGGYFARARKYNLLFLVSVCILGPIFEELLVRGIIFRHLQRVYPFSVALILQALAFAIYHMNIYQFSYTFLSGVLLGLVYHWTKSILSSIVAHIFLNTTVTILGFLSSDKPKETLEVAPSALTLFTTVSLILLISLGLVYLVRYLLLKYRIPEVS